MTNETYQPPETDTEVEIGSYEEFEDFDIEDYMEEDDLTNELDFHIDENYRGDPIIEVAKV